MRRKNSASTLTTQPSLQRMPSRKNSITGSAASGEEPSHAPTLHQQSFQKSPSKKGSSRDFLDDKVDLKPRSSFINKDPSLVLTHSNTTLSASPIPDDPRNNMLERRLSSKLSNPPMTIKSPSKKVITSH